MKKVIFMTGATGLVGGNLIHHFLEDKNVSRLYLLARGKNDEDAKQRVHKTIKVLSPQSDNLDPHNKIRVLAGDITRNNLALSNETYGELTNNLTHIVHSAANVKFQQSLESAMLVNFQGTKNVFELARSVNATNGISKIAYISTAYACGEHEGVFYEDDSFRPSLFANSYEESKYESDAYVQSLFRELPVTIFRPSIIVGDSESGITNVFNGLYAPLQLIFMRLIRFLPGRKNTKMDIVPVDYVSKAIVNIMNLGKFSDGKIFHLTSGADKMVEAGEVIKYATDFYSIMMSNAGSSKLQTWFLDSENYLKYMNSLSGAEATISKTLESFAPYTTLDRTFDNTKTLNALRGSGLSTSHFGEYCKKIFNYTVETNWGRKIKFTALAGG
jgi:long-chain acyl-CoA synthetase